MHNIQHIQYRFRRALIHHVERRTIKEDEKNVGSIWMMHRRCKWPATTNWPPRTAQSGRMGPARVAAAAATTAAAASTRADPRSSGEVARLHPSSSCSEFHHVPSMASLLFTCPSIVYYTPWHRKYVNIINYN